MHGRQVSDRNMNKMFSTNSYTMAYPLTNYSNASNTFISINNGWSYTRTGYYLQVYCKRCRQQLFDKYHGGYCKICSDIITDDVLDC